METMTMIELRFFESIIVAGNGMGSVRKTLQFRHGPCYPWVDVPCITLEQQALDKEHQAHDAIVYASDET